MQNGTKWRSVEETSWTPENNPSFKAKVAELLAAGKEIPEGKQ